MIKPIFKFSAFVLLVMKKDEHILLHKRINTGWGNGFFAVPSGHLDSGETVLQAAVRLGKEILNVKIKTEDISMVHVLYFKGYDGLEHAAFTVNVNAWEGEFCNQEPDKHEDVIWFPVAQIPEKTLPRHKIILKDIDNNIFYGEDGWGKQTLI
ncbi:MAG: NUDIX domain-containing protein [bacterium]